jgi:PAS domain S-box-containing protein
MSKNLACHQIDLLGSDFAAIREALSPEKLSGGFFRGKNLDQVLAETKKQIEGLEQRRADLKQQLDALCAGLDQVDSGVVIVGKDNRLILYNSAAEKLLGLDSLDVPLEQWPQNFHLHQAPNEGLCTSESLPPAVVLRDCEPCEKEIFVQANAASKGVWLKCSAVPIKNSDGSIFAALCIFQDITTGKIDTNLIAQLKPYMEREKRAELILEHTETAFLAIDSAGKVTDWNHLAERTFGWSSPEIIGRNLCDTLVPQRYREVFPAALAHLIRVKDNLMLNTRTEAAALHRDGHELSVELSIRFVTNPDGETSICAFANDTSQRAKIEDRRNVRQAVTSALADSLTYKEAILKILQALAKFMHCEAGFLWTIEHPEEVLTVQESYSTTDKLSSFVKENKSLKLQHGSSLPERVWKQREPGMVEKLARSNDEVQSQLAEKFKMTGTFAFPIVTDREVVGVMQFFVGKGRAPDNDMLHLCAALGKQIGRFYEGKRAQEESKALAAIVEYSDDAMFGQTVDETITSWNRGAEKTYGYEAREVVNKHISVLFSADQYPEYQKVVEQVIKDGCATRIETKQLTKIGRVIEVALTLSPVKDAAGKTLSVSVIGRDVTEQKQKEDQINKLNESLQNQVDELARVNDEVDTLSRKFLQTRDQAMAALHFKTEFLERMSREIRTPMNAIMGLSEMLLKTQQLTLEQQDFASIIRDSGTLLLNVFNDILDYSKIEDREVQLEIDDFDFSAALEEAADSVNFQARQKRLSILTFVAPEIPQMLRGDAKRVKQVLVKLFENTLKYMDRGTVTVRAILESADDSHIKVRIFFSDTGVGFTTTTRARIQKPFMLKENERFDGTNLGLSVVKHMVDLMEGSVGLERTNTGTGSSFWVVLPFERSQVVVAKPAIDDLFKNRKLLVIDGPTGSSRLIQAYCTKMGITCDWYVTAEDALSNLVRNAQSNTPYDITIMEPVMFGMDATALAETIRRQEELSSTQLMLYSQQLDDHHLQSFIKSGFSFVVTGPLKQSTFFNALEQVLKQRPTPSLEQMLAHHVDTSRLILMAEDNHINRKVALLQLASCGFEAHVANNGREAFEAAIRNNYSMILMDCEMPEMDGFEATEAIRKHEQQTGRHTPIIAMTANAIEGDREMCLSAGMDDYISKPIATDVLEATIRHWLAKSQSDAAGQNKTNNDKESVSKNGVDNHTEAANQSTEQNGHEYAVNTSNELIDLARLNRICGESGAKEIVREFLDSSDTLLSKLESAINEENPSTRRKASHELKGSCGALGFKQAEELSMTLQLLGDSDWEESRRLCKALNEAFHNLKQSLEPQPVEQSS